MTRLRPVLSRAEAAGRVRADHELLLARLAGLSERELAAEYRDPAGPLGEFCDSLHDLVAHVLMWDEINLGVLAEAAAGRVHWSLRPRWATPDAGRQLNQAGVAAGRHLPSPLLLHRLATVHDALLGEFGRYDDRAWTEVGGLAQRVWTVPGQPPFWHAAIHLRQLPGEAG